MEVGPFAAEAVLLSSRTSSKPAISEVSTSPSSICAEEENRAVGLITLVVVGPPARRHALRPPSRTCTRSLGKRYSRSSQ